MTRISALLRPLSILISLCVLLPGVGDSHAAKRRKERAPSARELKAELRFAADMASRGLWREALFRWERVLAERPDDPRLLNNIAVACEALGERERALEAYEKALASGAEIDPKIVANRTLFMRFQKRLEEESGEEDEEAAAAAEQVAGGTDS